MIDFAALVLRRIREIRFRDTTRKSSGPRSDRWRRELRQLGEIERGGGKLRSFLGISSSLFFSKLDSRFNWNKKKFFYFVFFLSLCVNCNHMSFQTCHLCGSSSTMNYCWRHQAPRICQGLHMNYARTEQGHIQSPLCQVCRQNPALIACFDENMMFCYICFRTYNTCVPASHSLNVIPFSYHTACRGLNRLPIIQSVGDGRDGGHGRGRRPRGRHSHVVGPDLELRLGAGPPRPPYQAGGQHQVAGINRSFYLVVGLQSTIGSVHVRNFGGELIVRTRPQLSMIGSDIVGFQVLADEQTQIQEMLIASSLAEVKRNTTQKKEITDMLSEFSDDLQAQSKVTEFLMDEIEVLKIQGSIKEAGEKLIIKMKEQSVEQVIKILEMEKLSDYTYFASEEVSSSFTGAGIQYETEDIIILAYCPAKLSVRYLVNTQFKSEIVAKMLAPRGGGVVERKLLGIGDQDEEQFPALEGV
ncbi:predicted protein [Arabidopsis lyrata subsp. lyrata]|uniref:Predicted protein n=1 Tax=Arabidopsis lyrata subsp. lyrata TaxID=81972 RepID=D7KYB8_ARALL|nr:predicted protein [Arabidopsis lyrata subsp. lyrata]